MRITATRARDIPALQQVLEATGLFPADMLDEMIAPFLGDAPEAGLWLSAGLEDAVVGFCHAIPEPLTDGAWNMLALAVLPARQGAGCGAALVRHLEKTLRDQGQRILIADTSGTAAFAPTRAFYQATGYTQEARIRDFWGPGDDKVVFWKSLG